MLYGQRLDELMLSLDRECGSSVPLTSRLRATVNTRLVRRRKRDRQALAAAVQANNDNRQMASTIGKRQLVSEEECRHESRTDNDKRARVGKESDEAASGEEQREEERQRGEPRGKGGDGKEPVDDEEGGEFLFFFF